jgi:hypothetical protein
MKTKEYVLKYKLNIDSKFNHNEFISDLTTDFKTLLETGKGFEKIKGFDNAVNAIRMKFTAINNKTIGCIPEKLWNYFYASVIIALKKQLFPQEMAQKDKERKEKKKEWEERQKWENNAFDDMFQGFFHNFYKNILKDISNIKPDLKYFKILNLDYDDNNSENIEEMLKKNYRKLAFKYHPDTGQNSNNQKFVEITEAKNKIQAYLMKK